MKPSHLKYRPEIDGLSALAVLSVVAFHAFPGLARGGFVGVDIFFVISGFLISNIVFLGLEQRRFREPDPATVILIVEAAVLLAWLTYRIVEKPIRISKGLLVLVPSALLGAGFLAGCCGYYVDVTNGAAGRTRTMAQAKQSPAAQTKAAPSAQTRTINADSKPLDDKADEVQGDAQAESPVTSEDPPKVGSGLPLSNSQCTLKTAESSASSDSDQVTINLSLTFSAKFSGTKTIDAQVFNDAGVSSDWEYAGTWGVH